MEFKHAKLGDTFFATTPRYSVLAQATVTHVAPLSFRADLIDTGTTLNIEFLRKTGLSRNGDWQVVDSEHEYLRVKLQNCIESILRNEMLDHDTLALLATTLSKAGFTPADYEGT